MFRKCGPLSIEERTVIMVQIERRRLSAVRSTETRVNRGIKLSLPIIWRLNEGANAISSCSVMRLCGD